MKLNEDQEAILKDMILYYGIKSIDMLLPEPSHMRNKLIRETGSLIDTLAKEYELDDSFIKQCKTELGKIKLAVYTGARP